MDKHNSGKYFYEFWAKLTLECLFPHLYSELNKSESPDLQDVDLNLGVEVAQIVRGQDRKDADFYYKYLRGKQKNESLETVLRNFEKAGKEIIIRDSIFHNGDNQIIGYFSDYRGINYDNLEDVLTKKLKKLNSNIYENVKICDLYLIWFDLFDEELADVMPVISSILVSYTKQFRYIYIDNKSTLLQYDVSNKKYNMFQQVILFTILH